MTTMDTALPPWRPLLRAAREREGRSPTSRWLQLATTAADGSPRVRTVVFRGWADAAVLDLLSDRRSAKAHELSRQPAVEMCWLLSKARAQFRLRGQLLSLPSILEERERQRHWQSLNPTARALWGWPDPGAPLEQSAAFPTELADGSSIPDSFLLLRFAIDQVELLELGGHPHRRRRWRLATAWQEEALNP